jgi:hypothetical protein
VFRYVQKEAELKKQYLQQIDRLKEVSKVVLKHEG